MISSSRLLRLDQHFDQRPVTLLSTQALICFFQQASAVAVEKNERTIQVYASTQLCLLNRLFVYYFVNKGAAGGSDKNMKCPPQ
jgi:hypothetical protein